MNILYQGAVIIAGTAIACFAMSGIFGKTNHDDYFMKDDGIMYRKFHDGKKDKKKK